LEGVVVIGYGTRKRQHLSGSVATVGSEVIDSRPVTNTMSAIQGQIPGMVVQRSSGQPGAEGFDLNVRGLSSVNGGNNPLVLIDGVAGDLSLLNPDDIESLTVLKDAAASIYGARAAGGVFLITTKKGRKGAPRISYSGNVAVSKLAGLMDAPTNYQFALMDNEANIHNNSAPMYTQDMLQKILNNDPNPIPHPLYGGWMLFFTNTDWEKELYTNGFQHKHNISVSGGGNNSAYYLSASYVDQDGVIRYANDNNKRYNLRLNYDYDFSKRIRLETKFSLENQKRSDVGGVGSYIITEGIFGMPNHPVYTENNGNFFAQGGWGNAVAMAKEGATATFENRNINTNFKVIADVVTGLKLNLQAGINYSNANYTDIANSFPLYTWDNSSIAYYSIANPTQTSLSRFSAQNTYRNFTGYLQYNRTFGGVHEIDVMAGASHEEADYDEFGAQRINFPTNEVWALNLGGTDNINNNGRGSHWAIRSLFSRLGYIYDNKYIVEANLRYDGSSRFHPDTRWGLFPGVSVAWRLTEEDFMSDIPVFDDIKIRASYGETGNQEGLNLYDYYQLITIGRPSWWGPYPFGAGTQGQSAFSDTMVSIDRTWETLVTKNVGIDLSLLSSKLNFSFDYFVKNNRDMLIPVTYPAVLGAIPPFSNSGELKTWGFETSIAWRDNIGKLDYSARVILSDSKNEVVYYGGQDTYVPGLNFIREGYPVNTYFAYEFDGLIRDQRELDAYKQLGGVPSDIGIGDARFRDVNGDGKIDAYSDVPGEDGDVINVGNTAPRFVYGVNLDAKFKGFDVGIFIQGIGKRTLFREGEYSIPWSDWWRQPPAFYFGKTWSADRPDAEYPRLSHGNIRYWNYQKSTLQKVNAAYVRLKNIQIGYTLPERQSDE
jgi:TonB-linked SusC/RagA family outer membrane protein